MNYMYVILYNYVLTMIYLKNDKYVSALATIIRRFK